MRPISIGYILLALVALQVVMAYRAPRADWWHAAYWIVWFLGLVFGVLAVRYSSTMRCVP